MPLFYFHLNNSTGWTRDEEGQQFHSNAAALDRALTEARALIAQDILADNPIKMSSYIAVEDESGREVGRVSYDEAVTLM